MILFHVQENTIIVEIIMSSQVYYSVKENVVFSTTLAENKNFTCNLLGTICIVTEFLLNQHIANTVFFFFLSFEACYLYYIPRKRIQVFSL